MRTPANSETSGCEYLAMHCSHPAPAGHSAASCRAGISLAIGAILFALSFQGGCSRNRSPFAGSRTLSPVELFQKVSPSVFVVQSLDEEGLDVSCVEGPPTARRSCQDTRWTETILGLGHHFRQTENLIKERNDTDGNAKNYSLSTVWRKG